ncbi:hypothetical protein [Aidingimonas lacisalsi]|uniref:hypothetical protein n=1 Tax=Aidingimonas lacisalsi TaxID=2604086 RepID=UPI0011D26946|nr:hypothetical protein [Aidingimonas lacisalsi]
MNVSTGEWQAGVRRDSRIVKRRTIWPLAWLCFFISSTTPAGFVAEMAIDPFVPEVDAPMAEPLAFSQQPVIDASELEGMRGGFNIAGLDVDFGARLRTQIDNIRYETVLSITQAGTSVVSETLNDMGFQANQQLIRVGQGSGSSLENVLPANVALPGLNEFSGVTLNDPKGFSAALHNVTRDAIMSSVVSNASDRDIRQYMNLDVKLNNVNSLRDAQQRSVIMNSLF